MPPRVTDADWSKILESCAEKVRKLHGMRDGMLHNTRENNAHGAQCVLVDIGRRNEILYVSRSLGEFVGTNTTALLGKSCLSSLYPTTHWLDDLFNGSERRHLQEFCHSCDREPVGSANGNDLQHLSLMVLCKASEQAFWGLVHTMSIQGPDEGDRPGRPYILHIITPLEARLPETIWITDAGEARLAAKANAEAIKPFLDQVHQDVKARQCGMPVAVVVSAAERRVDAFRELMSDAFLGTRFVPRVGRQAATEFERLGLREKVFEAIEAELRKAWQATDEVCKNTASSFVPAGSASLACAVSDPCSQDCPLVYISSGFEALTGFRASWTLGRNCRFLQPQTAGHAPVAVNRVEVERLHKFCKARSGIILSMLLNESASGEFFWNLLFMQHLLLDSSDNQGMRRHYIFAVQTDIHTPDLTQLILKSWDTGAGQYRLQRLREILTMHEEGFNPREKSLFALRDEAFGTWAKDVSLGNSASWAPTQAVRVGTGGGIGGGTLGGAFGGGGAGGSASIGFDDFAQTFPLCFNAAVPTLRRIFHMGDRDLEDMRANMPGGVVFCISDPEEKECPLIFVSKGFEEMTGFKEDYAVGKNCRFLQPPLEDTNKAVNGEELRRLRHFCDVAGGRHHNEAIVSLLLNERKTGERFFNLLHMQHLDVDGKRYIMGVQSILQVPIPSMLRVARNLTPVEEAQHSHFLQQLGELMGKVRPLVDTKGLADMDSAVQLAVEHLRSFFANACPDYEGDHWVPCLGLPEANTFHKDMLWHRAFEEMKSSLKKIWEVSQGCEEEVAIAIADPSGKDCPLVYVSAKFEQITGYSRDWAIGRNCRFLQPNVSWCNAAFNREEVKAMHSFCEDALPRGSRIVNLLVNEHKNRYPFINLLVMEHIEVPMPKGDPEPGTLYTRQTYRPFIFGVQTALDNQVFALVELLAMDREALKQLDRLRQILRKRGSTLRFQSLNTFARECIAEWLPGVPAFFSLPRVRLGVSTSWSRATVPAVGLEVNAQNILEAVPQAMEEGVRHFYLTFVPSDKNDESQNQLQMRLLSLRLTELLDMMVPGFYHYLRSNVSFTLVTPPAFVRAYEDVARALFLHSYLLDAWLLDLRQCPDRVDMRYFDYWRLMTGVRTAGGVGNIGVLGACRAVCEKLSGEGAGSIGVLGVELYPQRQWVDQREKNYYEQQASRGVMIVACGIFGPGNQFLYSDAVADEADRLQADPATLLMKWVEGQGYAMMVPRLRLHRPKAQLQQRKSFSRQVSVEPGSPTSPTSPTSPSAPGREANFHRSFAKEYSSLLPGAVDDFFRRCHTLHSSYDGGSRPSSPTSPACSSGRRPQPPTSPSAAGGPSPRRRSSMFGAPAVQLRSMDDGLVASRPRPQSASKFGASAVAGGPGFDAARVRSSMKLQQAASARGGGGVGSLAVNSSRNADLQSLALEFSLSVDADQSSGPRLPVERRIDQFVRKTSGMSECNRRAVGG